MAQKAKRKSKSKKTAEAAAAVDSDVAESEDFIVKEFMYE